MSGLTSPLRVVGPRVRVVSPRARVVSFGDASKAHPTTAVGLPAVPLGRSEAPLALPNRRSPATARAHALGRNCTIGGCKCSDTAPAEVGHLASMAQVRWASGASAGSCLRRVRFDRSKPTAQIAVVATAMHPSMYAL